jgi:bifunctional UDP-N-acetylglucosamine pyrophosphorylase/glucosamine-1-phosphate N-acetyltransferase
MQYTQHNTKENFVMKNITGIILAAGEGTRMKSAVPKVLHKVGGKPMLTYMLGLFEKLGINKYIVVVGHKAEKVKEILQGKKAVKTVKQQRLLGSADAVWQAKHCFSNFKGNVIIVYGDTPLLSYHSLNKIIYCHQQNRAACTILTAFLKNPTGFGRVVRDGNNRIVKIIEEQDADRYEKTISEINVGVYCFRVKELFSALERIKPNNVKKEYYLTDTIEELVKKKAKVESVCTDDEKEAWGVNSRQDIVRANSIINKRNIEKLISAGVTIVDPVNTYIYGDIEIGCDTIIYPYTIIEGKVQVGRSCLIGPFARLRPGSVLQDNVQIGNFVEIVRSKIGSDSKIKHHSYIGDAVVGKRVNIGAGTITANYDNKTKNPTFIDDEAFIGVGTILIAPVKIGKRAITGAGSVVTKNKDVPAGATVAGIPAHILKKKK